MMTTLMYVVNIENQRYVDKIATGNVTAEPDIKKSIEGIIMSISYI